MIVLVWTLSQLWTGPSETNAYTPVSNKTVDDVSGVNFNNQHCVELLAVILSQGWFTNLCRKQTMRFLIYLHLQPTLGST